MPPLPDSQTPAPSSSAEPQVPSSDVPAAPSSSATPADTASSPDAGQIMSDREGLLKAVASVVKVEGMDAGTPPAEAPAAAGDEKPAPETDTGNVEKADTAAAKAQTEPADKTEGDDADLTADELRHLKPKAQRRFQQLTERVKTLAAEADTYRQDAEKFSRFTSYLAQNDLGGDDVELLLGVGAALRRGDFKTFLEGVMPYVRQAQEAVGEVLPDELQKQVDDGYMTADAAKELARTRHEAATYKAKAERVETTVQQTQAQQAALTMKSAVQSWEDTVKARDPDYALKADAVKRVAQGIIAEKGLPRTADQAVAIVRDAYEEVTRLTQAARPALQPTRPAPSSVHVPTTAVAEPRNLMEAAMLGLQQARRSA